MLQKIKARRTAMLTGWALTPGAVHRYQTDACFPLSDHADYDDLLRYVELVKPRRVLTLHGYAAAFAADLRARGVEAWALSEENQMEMTFASVSVGEVARRPGRCRTRPTPVAALEPSEFAAFARVGDAIAATTGKLRKIEILSEYFRTLDDDALPIAALYLAGRAFAQSDPRVLNIGSAVIKRALAGGQRRGRGSPAAIGQFAGGPVGGRRRRACPDARSPGRSRWSRPWGFSATWKRPAARLPRANACRKPSPA